MTLDLSTRYMGLTFNNPLIASASPLSANLDGIRQLEDAGIGGIVLFSLLEEQIRKEQEEFEDFMSAGGGFAEVSNFFPRPREGDVTVDAYLELIRQAKTAVDVPIIASLNGVTIGGWAHYAKLMESAGADGIELNIYYLATNIEEPESAVMERYLQPLRAVKEAVAIPVALKVMPFFTAFGHFAKTLDEAGVDSIVMFNRLYQPDFDIRHLEVTANLEFSHASEIRLPLLWLAVLRGRIRTSLAASRGVKGCEEVVKYLLAGADAVMVASVLLDKGPRYVGVMLDGLREWMGEHTFGSVEEMKGRMSKQHIAQPELLERAYYLRVLGSYGG